jgi:hypothetical protein
LEAAMRYLPALSVSLILLAAGIASARNGGAHGAAEPRSVVVTVSGLRLDRAADGTTKETILQKPIISTIDNTRGWTEVSGKDGAETRRWTTVVFPHINQDGSIKLRLEVQDAEEGGPEETVRSVVATRTLQPGKTVRIEGFIHDGAAVVFDVSAAEMNSHPRKP